MQPGEFDLGQMLRDADISSVEDLEEALREAALQETIGEVLQKEANWSSFKQLLKTDLVSHDEGNGRALQEVLERAGWVSAAQLGLVLEAIDQYGDGIGQQLVAAGLIDDVQLDSALRRAQTEDKPLWRVLVNAGKTDVRQIALALGIEDRLLGQLLLDRGHIDVKTLQQHLNRAREDGTPVSLLLSEHRVVAADVVAQAWAELYNLPYREVRHIHPSRELMRRFRLDQLVEDLILPIGFDDDVLRVAVGHPPAISRLKYLWDQAGTRIEAAIAPVAQITERLAEIREENHGDGGSRVLLKDVAGIDPDEAPADIVTAVLREAFANRGSDLHFDPTWDQMIIRVRIDGVLHDLVSVAPTSGTQIVSRLKALARLDISDSRHPHDGHLSEQVGPDTVDMRISTVPTKYGEKVVLRLINDMEVVSRFTGLGMSESQAGTFDGLLRAPYGLMLCAGPVGSGKTTTLYCALNKLNVPERNLVTLEDPIEYSLTRVNQIQVAEKLDFDFSDGLRALLRQDPDVMMLGEIRDHESARVAVRASMSGVLVMSSIHANDSVGAVDTLLNLDISPYLISNSLIGAVSQRLCRRLCRQCAESYRPDPALATELGFTPDEFDGLRFQRGTGCSGCLGTGYKGLVGIFETLEINEALREMILRTEGKSALRTAAERCGMRTMAESAREKIRAGVTTPQEFLKNIAV